MNSEITTNIWKGSTVWRAIKGFGGLGKDPLMITMIAWLLKASQHTFSRHLIAAGYPPRYRLKGTSRPSLLFSGN